MQVLVDDHVADQLDPLGDPSWLKRRPDVWRSRRSRRAVPVLLKGLWTNAPLTAISALIGFTSLASTITVLEITGYAKRLMSQTFAIFEIFAIAGLLYLVINLALIAVIRSIERYLMRHESLSRQGSSAPHAEESAAVS